MKHISASAANTGSVYEWLERMVEIGDCDPADIVWSVGDGGYAIGDPADTDDPGRYYDAGTVGEWLAEEEHDNS